MISWDRQGDRMVLIFSPRQIRWLRRHLTRYWHMIDHAEPGILNALPDQGGVVIVDNSKRLQWAWILQDLMQLTLARLRAIEDDRVGSGRAADGLQSWLGEVAARLMADIALDDNFEQQLSDLVHNREKRKN